MFGFINRVNQVIQTPFICKEIQVLFPVLVLCTCTCKRESQRVYTRNVSTQISLQSLWQNYIYLISSVLVNLTFVSAIHVHVQLQGSKDDAVLRALASQQSAGPIPRLSVIHCICGFSLLLVVIFAPRGFPLGTPVFPSPQKPTLLNSNLI